MNNILCIDYAKFIGIYLVILGHSLQGFSVTCGLNFIYMFHMPLFFIIAGFLYNQKTKEQNYRIIFNRLIIPYVIYQVIYFPIKAISLSVSQHTDIITTVLKTLCGSLLGDCYHTHWSFVNCGVCWFILTMIYLRFIFANIKLSKINLIILFLISIIIIKTLFIFNFDLLFCLDNLIYFLPYFILGYYFKQYIYTNNTEKFSNINSLCAILFAVLSFTVVYIILKYNGLIGCNMHIQTSIINKSILLSYIAGCLGTVGVLLISYIFKYEFKYISIISKNTLFIMFFHAFLLLIIKVSGIIPVLHKLINNEFCMLGFVIVFSLLILFISYFVIINFESRIPLLFGKTKNVKH